MSRHLTLEEGIALTRFARHTIENYIRNKAKAEFPDLFGNLVLFSAAGTRNENSSEIIKTVVVNKTKGIFTENDRDENLDILINLIYHPLDLFKIANMFKELSLEEEFRRIDETVLIFWAKEDELFPVENLKEFTKHFKNKKTFILDGEHRRFMNEKGSDICQILRRELIKD